MPVSLTEWRVRIGRFIQNPPDINKREMIQRFLDRWKAKNEKAKTAADQLSYQDQTPCKSAKKEKSKMAACQQTSQIPCEPEKPSCTPETSLMPSTIGKGSAVLSCFTQVLLTLLTLMMTCFQCIRKCSSVIVGRYDSPVETSHPPKVLLPTSSCCFRGLNFCRRMISYTMHGFCHLYLPVILLMRSGDVETNPGPNTPESTISEMEFLNLARDIHPSYYIAVGISLGIPYAQLEAILIEKLNNFTNALLAVFMKWNVKQQPPHTNKREILADKLQENDLGDLSDRLRNGCLLPNSTGGPSRPPESRTQPPSAESQTEPLSPELIERCANDFKFKYRSTLCKIRADPLNPASLVQFEDMYTNLVLQEEYGRGKRMLDYNDILDLRVNREFPKRIMVQGEAGAGKTTLCAKIAWDWIEGRHFSHFVWVLIVPLRESKQYTIGEIAKSYLARNNPATVSQITEYISANPGKVFIAFDGLDEFSGKVLKKERDSSKSECHQSQSTDQMQLQPSQPVVDSSEACEVPSQRAGIGLVEILCSDQLASCPVLVTTRPWRAIEIRSDGNLMKLYTFIHVEGFSRENLSVYIHKYFAEDDARANQLIQFTHENDVISNMAHYPIYLAMLCLMWKELSEQKLKKMISLQTFSQIFKEMIGFLKEHYTQKKIKKVGSPSLIAYLKEINKLLEPVAKQAFTGLLKNTLIFRERDFMQFPESMETAYRVGVLSQGDRLNSVEDSSSDVNSHMLLPVFFTHKLFQEYMAGVYLASLYESDHNEFNRLINQQVLPRKEEFRFLLYFTVSQNKSVAIHVTNSMIQKSDMSEMDRDFIVDIALESQDLDAARLVKGKVCPERRVMARHQYLTSHTMAGYAFLDEVQSVPPEILARGLRACRAYASALQDGKKKIFRTRLMLVGQECVGKTSLKKSLTGQRFDPKEGITDSVDSTDSCEITIECVGLAKADESSWPIEQKGKAEDEFQQILADRIVSKLQEETSQEQASSEASIEAPVEGSTEADSNETNARGPYQEQAGGHEDKIPEDIPQVKAATSKLDRDRSWNEDETVSTVKEALVEMEAPEAPKAPEATRKDEEIPDGIASLVEEKLRVDEADSTKKKGEDKASLNIWDFGGHDVYYTTHQVFLTWRAIYVVVFDLSTDLDSIVSPECRDRHYKKAKQGTKSELTCLEFITFWLFSIYTHAVMPSSVTDNRTGKKHKSPPIFIVGTHREKVEGSESEKKEKIKAAFARIREAIKGKPFECHVIPRYYQVENSLVGDMELDKLRKHIEEVAKEEPYMGEERPLRWLKFEDHAANNQNFMSLDQIKEQTQQMGIESEEELFTMLNFYHDLGSVVYYGDVEESTSVLRDIVILNPQWLIDVFKQVITILDPQEMDAIVSDAWSTLEDHGILEDRLIQHMWQKFQEQKDALIELMIKFDLICEAPSNWSLHEEAEYEVSEKTGKDIKDIKKCYYVPSRLKLHCQQKDMDNIKSSFEFFIEFCRFLPEGLFHRLMARVVEWVMERTGERSSDQVRLFHRQIRLTIDDKHEALMEMLPPSEATIKVTVFQAKVISMGDDSTSRADPPLPDPPVVREVKDFLIKTLDSLKKQLAKNLQYHICFACPECSERKLFEDCLKGKVVFCGGHRILSKDILSRFGHEEEPQVKASNEEYSPVNQPVNTVSSRMRDPADRTETTVTQEQLDKVSRKLPGKKFTTLCMNLMDMDFNEATNILMKNHLDYHQAGMEVLMAWKTKTGGPYSQLATVLTDTDTADLVALIQPGTSPSTSVDDHSLAMRQTPCAVTPPAQHEGTTVDREVGNVRKRVTAQIHSSTDQQAEPHEGVPYRLREERQEREWSTIMYFVLFIVIILLLLFTRYTFYPSHILE